MQKILGSLLAASSLALAQSPCDLPFAPAKVGWEWQYKVTGGKSSSVSVEKTKISATGFVEVFQFGNQKIEASTVCNQAGITRIGIDPMAFELPGGEGPSVQMKANKLEGAQIPNDDDWKAGQNWKFSADLDGSMKFGIISATIDGITKGSYKVVALEKVSVPAGTFDAVKISANLQTNLNLSAGLLKREQNSKSEPTYWYAKGVGLVKMVVGNTTYELIALKK